MIDLPQYVGRLTAGVLRFAPGSTTPQTGPIQDTTHAPNESGGPATTVDCWTSLDRCLVVGSVAGGFRVGAMPGVLPRLEFARSVGATSRIGLDAAPPQVISEFAA